MLSLHFLAGSVFLDTNFMRGWIFADHFWTGDIFSSAIQKSYSWVSEKLIESRIFLRGKRLFL